MVLPIVQLLAEGDSRLTVTHDEYACISLIPTLILSLKENADVLTISYIIAVLQYALMKTTVLVRVKTSWSIFYKEY